MNSDETATIIDFSSHRSGIVSTDPVQEQIDLCLEIIEQLKSGECTGIVYALRKNGKNHKVGATGDYVKMPLEVCVIAGAMFNHFSALGGVVVKHI